MSEFSKYVVYVDESGHSNWTAAPEYPLLCLKDFLKNLPLMLVIC